MKNQSRLVAAVATCALALGSLGVVSSASAVNPEPCAKQSAQVTKATEALERVTKVFAKQQAKVVKAKKAVAKADTRSERAKAKKALKSAKAKRAVTVKAKKAQVQRLAKATQRLTDCLAKQAPAA